MIFRAHEARIADLAARIGSDRARMHSAARSMAATARRMAGSPAGLAACFVAGLLAGPLLGSVGRASANRLGVRAVAAAAAWAWQTYFAGGMPGGGVADTSRPMEMPGEAVPLTSSRR